MKTRSHSNAKKQKRPKALKAARRTEAERDLHRTKREEDRLIAGLTEIADYCMEHPECYAVGVAAQRLLDGGTARLI